MSMTIGLHGGNCCGIKIIYNLGPKPEHIEYAKDETTQEHLSADRHGEEVCNPYFNFYWKSAPPEKAIERFDRYLSYIEQVRHYGLVEVTLAVSTHCASPSLHGYTVEQLELGNIETFEEAVDIAISEYEEGQGADRDYEEGGEARYDSWLQDSWIPELESRGFRKVSRFPNINSGNMVEVYHLVMDGNYYKNKEKK